MARRRSRGMSGHHSAKPKTRSWATPPEIIRALGGWRSFDLDPCSMLRPPYPIARRQFTRRDNGLKQKWFGRVFMNPPYGTGVIEAWLAMMAEHGRGTALIFARTETEAFMRHVSARASGMLFIAGRLHFHRRSGRRAAFNAGAPSVLVAYGPHDLDVLAGCVADAEYASNGILWPSGRIPGLFVPLQFPRHFLATSIDGPAAAETWSAIVDEVLKAQAGPVPVTVLYRALAEHPRARRNRNWKPKIRQTLQRGRGRSFRHVGQNQWAAAR